MATTSSPVDPLFGCSRAHHGEEGVGEHGQGDVPVPADIAANLVLIQAAPFFAAWKHSSIAHRAPATRTSWSTVASSGAQPRY